MPANPFSDGLSVRVSGDSSDARRALGGLQSSILSTRKLALGLGGVLAGALAVQGLGAATRAAADFETAMVEVQKVTDEETAAALAGEMRELSTEIPVAQEELAALAADAARFGIRGTENIRNFTETVSRMSVATDLSTQEAGEAFARLSVLTETPVDQMENLGSAINALSNEMATSSGEIVDSMLRSSAALNQFGLNNRQIVGMSAALNEVSESSRRAGSRLRRVAQELLDPRKVGDVARALGMTEAEFKNLRREQPDQIMLRLAEAFAEGGRTAEELRGTLSTASRQAVAGLAQNLDGLRTALQRSNETFAEGTSLQKEFDAATQTFNSRMQVLKNNINEVAITIGNDLLPVLNPLLETLNDLISGSEDLEATFGTETAEDIRGITSAFDDLVGPVEDNAEEILDLSTKLFILGQGVLPHVAPALRDMRFVLEGTASALQTVNDALDRSLELWDDLPPSLREAAIEGATTAATAPIGGPSTLRGVRAARRGIEESDQTLSAATATSVTGADARREGDQIIITVEGDTDVIRNVTAEQMTREGNRVFAETGSR